MGNPRRSQYRLSRRGRAGRLLARCQGPDRADPRQATSIACQLYENVTLFSFVESRAINCSIGLVPGWIAWQMALDLDPLEKTMSGRLARN